MDDRGKELSVSLGACRHRRRCFHLLHEFLGQAALFVFVLKSALSPESGARGGFVLRERHAVASITGIAIARQQVLLRRCDVVCWNLRCADALLE